MNVGPGDFFFSPMLNPIATRKLCSDPYNAVFSLSRVFERRRGGVVPLPMSASLPAQWVRQPIPAKTTKAFDIVSSVSPGLDERCGRIARGRWGFRNNVGSGSVSSWFYSVINDN